MIVGFTYDLQDDYLRQGCSLEEAAEFDSMQTINAIDETLQQLGFTTERIGNLTQLISALYQGRRWDVVFNIAEGRYGLAREAQVPALLDAYQIPYVFSDPMTLALCLDKSMAKRIVRDHGIPTAPFWVLANDHDIVKHADQLHFPLFVKPLAEGSSKGISAYSQVTSLAMLQESCNHLWQAFKQPVLAEVFLPGREFTVGLLGSGETAKVLGVMEVQFNANAEMDSYSFINKQDWKRRISLTIVNDMMAQHAAQVAKDAWCALRCKDAGRIDIRVAADGTPCFLEVNPLAGLNPENSDLILMGKMQGLSYHTILQGIMQAACKRLALSYPAVSEVVV